MPTRTPFRYTIGRGEMIDGGDNRAERWYWWHRDGAGEDRAGIGYRTRREAIDGIMEHIRQEILGEFAKAGIRPRRRKKGV